MNHPLVKVQPFGLTPDSSSVDLFVLGNAAGCKAVLSSYGASLIQLMVPDREGVLADVVLGFDELEGYLKDHPYFGATVGRVANRIAGAEFKLDGQDYVLNANDGVNHLHGGFEGLDRKVWQGRVLDDAEHAAVEFSYLSPDGEEGYPGDLSLKVRYTLTDTNVLKIDYVATSNRTTPINLSNHAYFNLRDGGGSPVLDHELTLNADAFTPVDDQVIPTGEILPVAGGEMDFRQPVKIGERVNAPALAGPGGYDHNYVLNKTQADAPEFAARVVEPVSGRAMEVWTTEPGIQFYSGNFLDGSLTGRGGAVYHKRHGFCLETQHFPDALHHENFPSILLKAGETYTQNTEYRFSVV